MNHRLYYTFSRKKHAMSFNEHLTILCLPLANRQYAIVVSAYAPMLERDDKTKEEFYSKLIQVLLCVPKENQIILLGDFNTRVGRDSEL